MLAELHKLVEGRINLMLIDGLLRGMDRLKGLKRRGREGREEWKRKARNITNQTIVIMNEPAVLLH